MKKLKFIILIIWYSMLRFGRKGGRQKHLLIGLAVIIGLFGLAFFWSNFSSQEKVSEGIVGIYTPRSMPSTVTNLISKSLVTLDQTGKPQPSLAESWQANNEATVYTLKLKNNLYWDDGTKVKSSEIKFNIPDVNVEYPDDNTIIFKLADSFAPFPTLLTNPVFKNNSLIGVGNYKVAKVDSTRGVITKMILLPNQATGNKNSSLPVVNIRFYPDEKIAQTAFKLGEVDSLIGLSEDTDLLGAPSVGKKGVANYNKLTAVFFNTKDPILSDKNLRKALNMSIPAFNVEQAAKTSIPDWSWAFNDTLKNVHGDTEGAKAYLNKVENGKNSTITLTTTPALAGVGENIIVAWKKIGINAVLRVESGVPQNFQALLFSENIPSDPDQYTLWHSTQAQTNLSRYSSARVDKDLEDGRKSANQDKRKELYLNLQKELQDDAPAAFLYFPKTNIIYRVKAEKSLSKVLTLQIR